MRKIISVVALLCVVVSASAQSMGFLLVSGDAASSGIAGASIAMPGSAYAPDLNMAAAALSAKKMDAAAGYTLWSPSFGKNGLVSASGYFKATDKLAIGADWKQKISDTADVIKFAIEKGVPLSILETVAGAASPVIQIPENEQKKED